MIFTSFFFPFFIISLFLMLFLISNVSIKYLTFCFAVLTSLFSLIIDYNYTYYSDVIRYYSESYDMIDIFIVQFKLYRVANYFFLNYLGLRVEYYGAISIFIISYTVLQISLIIISDYCVDIKTPKQKVIFLLCNMSTLPISTFLGFETMLALSFSFLGIIMLLKNRRIFGYIMIALAISVHVLSFYLLILYFLYKIIVRMPRGVGNVIIILSVLFCIYALNHRVAVGVQIFDVVLGKAYNYFNGAWSKYDTIHDKMILLYGIVNTITFAILSRIILKRDFIPSDFIGKIVGYLVITLVFSLVFQFSRTLNLRLVVLPAFFFNGFLYLAIMKFELGFKTKLLILSFVLFNLFSYHNLLYGRFMFNNFKFGDGYFFIMSIDEINRFQPNYPKHSILYSDQKSNF